MNKKILYPVLLVISTIMIFAFAPKIKSCNTTKTVVKAEEGIQFIEENWSKAKAEANKKNNLFFMDADTS